MNPSEDKRVYILDTNALIQFSLWLPIDLNKNFWTKFEESLGKGEWVLLDVMVDEIKFGNDGLKKWCDRQKQKGLMRSITDDHRNRGAEINNTYKMIDDVTGKSTGDTYLIAYAESNKLIVFSREAPRKGNGDLYKIPDVCKALKVELIYKPREFLEAIGYRN
ncbi:MAG: DUF4411 family protein [Patescibacteria group bacterium]